MFFLNTFFFFFQWRRSASFHKIGWQIFHVQVLCCYFIQMLPKTLNRKLLMGVLFCLFVRFVAKWLILIFCFLKSIVVLDTELIFCCCCCCAHLICFCLYSWDLLPQDLSIPALPRFNFFPIVCTWKPICCNASWFNSFRPSKI